MRLCNRIVATTGRPQKADEQQRAAPAQQQCQSGGRRRGSRKPDMPDKGMKGEGPAQFRPIHRPAEDRIIRRVNDRIADPRQQRQPDHLPICGCQPHRRDRQGHQQGPADKKPPRAVAVDEKPHRRLHHRRRARHDRHRQPQFGERDIESPLPGDEQRRQTELVEMRQKVPGAEQRVDPSIATESQPIRHPPMLL
jgi:hypothetical protein